MHYSILFSFLFYGFIIYIILKLLFGRKRKYHRWLKKQIPLWEEKNILSQEQSDNILGFYNLSRIDLKNKMDMVKVMTLIGSIFVGIGVIFFVGSNWQKIPSYIKTIILLGTTILTLSAGYFFSYEKGGFKNLGKSLILLASLLWGGTIALICQIYQIPASENWYIMLLWAFPIIPIAIFFENDYVYILSSVLLLIWNFLYSHNNHVANYYYPAVIFGLMLPMAKGYVVGRRINIAALLTASIYGAFLKYEWLTLIISSALLIFYLIKKREEKLYLYTASVSFICWSLAYFNLHQQQPNFYFLIPLGILFYLTYKDKLKENLILCIGSLIIWMNLILHSFALILNYKINAFNYIILHSFVGLLLYSVGIISKNKKHNFYGAYKLFGFLIAFICIYILSFKGVFQVLGSNSLYFVSSLALAVITAILIGYNFIKGYFKNREDYIEISMLLIILAVNILFLLNPEAPAINTIISNIVLVLIAISNVSIGVESQKSYIFNMGIAVFVLFIITRYIDMAWKLKEKSLFFIIGGLVMIIGGTFLEKQRRKIIQRMKSK